MKKLLLILLCLPMIGFGQDNITGIWVDKGKGYENTLILSKVQGSDNSYSFSFDGYRVSYDYFSKDTVRFFGQMSNPVFIIQVKNNKAHYDDDVQEFEEGWEIYNEGEERCNVYFTFKEKSIIVKTELCSLIYGGFGVSFDGEYFK